ncbi:hypothetical protein [Pontibacter flavimaris]|nr:hypothetical protein [Pontibacter flavimaris]
MNFILAEKHQRQLRKAAAFGVLYFVLCSAKKALLKPQHTPRPVLP